MSALGLLMLACYGRGDCDDFNQRTVTLAMAEYADLLGEDGELDTAECLAGCTDALGTIGYVDKCEAGERTLEGQRLVCSSFACK